ncbi:MAG: hypothetical protein AAF849_00765 [Bacteroidota bacterium]
MKDKLLFSLLLLSLIIPLNGLQAQFRPFEPVPISGTENNEGITAPQRNNRNSNGEPQGFELVDIYGNPICCEENPGGLDLELTFFDIQILAQIEAALNAAAESARNEWLRKQENIIRDEINRRFNSNHRTFREAQKALFREWDSNVLTFAFNKGLDFQRSAARIGIEQLKHTKELIHLNEFKDEFSSKLDCERIYGFNHPACNIRLFNDNRQVRGLKSRDVRSFSQLNSLHKNVMDDFQDLEFDEGDELAIASALFELSEDNSYLESIVNKRISHYNNRSLRDKILIMTAYIIRLGGSSLYYPTPVPRISIPQYWSEYSLRQYGIDNKKTNEAAALFGPQIQNTINGTPCINQTIRAPGPRGTSYRTVCGALPPTVKANRDRIIQEHMDGFERSYFFQKVKETPDFFPQRHDYETSLREIAKGLRKFGGSEGRAFADYIEDILDNDIGDFTVGDVRAFHGAMKEITIKFNTRMRLAIFGAYYEGLVLPLAEVIATELAFGAAVKVVGKLPAIFKHPEFVKLSNKLNSFRKLPKLPLSEFEVASKFGIDKVSALKNFFKVAKIKRSELGLEIHHILEQRFWQAGRFPAIRKADDINGVVLTEAEHATFSRRWRELIPTTQSAGLNTATATREQILAAGKEVYKNHPDLLKAFLKYF